MSREHILIQRSNVVIVVGVASKKALIIFQTLHHHGWNNVL